MSHEMSQMVLIQENLPTRPSDEILSFSVKPNADKLFTLRQT